MIPKWIIDCNFFNLKDMGSMRHRHNSSGDNKDVSVLNQTKKFLEKVDIYPKLQEEYRVQTSTGANLTVLTTCLMLLLFFNEL